MMSRRQRFEAALRLEPTDRPPHFEQLFELEHEAFGRHFADLRGLDAAARDRALNEGADLMLQIAEHYGWDALNVWFPPQVPDGINAVRRRIGDALALGTFIWDGIWSIDVVRDWDAFALDLVERPEQVHAEARSKLAAAKERAQRCIDGGADFLIVGSDVGFNGGPFLSPTMFREFVTPYLCQLVGFIRDRGAKVIYHSDGQIMPVLDQIMEAGPHCWQSVDPMAGVDIAEALRRTAGRMGLMGNVACNALQDGPESALRASARYCLNVAGDKPGYIYSSSNTIFTGVPLAHYHIMLDEFRQWCAATGRPVPRSPT